MRFKYIKKCCFLCGELYKARNNEQIFCSLDCSREFKRRRKFVPCKLCGHKKEDSLRYCEVCKGLVQPLNKLRFEILKRDGFTCQYCGRKAPDVELHIDHIIPFSKGGLTEPNNLVTSCFNCNMGKSNISLESKIQHKKLLKKRKL